ncbi:MAG: toll/interleukin-1 receptor domain-containing protein [Cyanobacteria bacterium P01_A01_bin.123]
MPEVFISYASEDRSKCEQLYRDLRAEGYDVWLDSQDLVAGSNWSIEIRKAIRGAQYFIIVLSSNSVSKRGYVQKEIREALDVLDEFPESETFIVPIRLEPCNEGFERLKTIQRVDMFPNWDDGVARIIRALKRRNLNPGELVNLVQNTNPTARLRGDTIRLPHRETNPVAFVAFSRDFICEMARKLIEKDINGFFEIIKNEYGTLVPAGTLVEVIEWQDYKNFKIVRIKCLEGELIDKILWTVSLCIP